MAFLSLLRMIINRLAILSNLRRIKTLIMNLSLGRVSGGRTLILITTFINKQGVDDVKALFDSIVYFNNPKPIKLIHYLAES